MGKYRSTIIKTIIIIILIIIMIILNKKETYIPEEITPINSYYTEDELDFEEMYVNKRVEQFMLNLKNKDYSNIYNMLSQECKEIKFNNEMELEKYLQNTYPEYVDIKDNETLFFSYYDYSEFDSLEKPKKINILIGKREDEASIYAESDIPSIKITLVINGLFDMNIEM